MSGRSGAGWGNRCRRQRRPPPAQEGQDLEDQPGDEATAVLPRGLRPADDRDPGDEEPVGERRDQRDGPPSTGAWVIPRSRFRPRQAPMNSGAEPGVLQPGVIGQDARGEHGGHDRAATEPLARARAGAEASPSPPSQAAVRLEHRPEGRGRPGRSRRSTSKSKTSLSAVPDA